MGLLSKIKIHYINKKFILYSLIGFTGVTLNYLLFYVLTETTDINYIVVNIFSVTLGITNNFILNVLVNFKLKDRLIYRYLMFVLVGCLGMLISSTILYIFHGILGINIYLCKVISILFVVIVQYNLNSSSSFKKHD